MSELFMGMMGFCQRVELKQMLSMYWFPRILSNKKPFLKARVGCFPTPQILVGDVHIEDQDSIFKTTCPLHQVLLTPSKIVFKSFITVMKPSFFLYRHISLNKMKLLSLLSSQLIKYLTLLVMLPNLAWQYSRSINRYCN